MPIPVLVGYGIVIGTPNNSAGLFATFLVATGIYPFNTLMATRVTNNLQNEHVRSIGIPLLFCIANASGLASSQIYPSKDSPRYTMGNSISLRMEFIALLCYAGMWWVVRSRNAKLKRSREDIGFVFIE